MGQFDQVIRRWIVHLRAGSSVVAVSNAALCLILFLAPVQAAPDFSASDLTVQELSVGAGENAVAIGDVTCDGHADLVVSEETTSLVLVLEGDGTGALSAPRSYAAGPNPSWIAIADLNGDGATDLAIANHEVDSATLLLGACAKPFQIRQRQTVSIASQPHAHMIAAADLSGNGHLDLVLDSRDRAGVVVLQGRGAEGFSEPGVFIETDGAPYLGFALADLNADGKLDIVAPGRNSLLIRINQSVDGLRFVPAPNLSIDAPFAVGAGDFNGDGAVDLLAASESAATGSALFISRGDGTFAPLEDFPTGGGAKSIAIGDINGDGLADAVVASWEGEAHLIEGSRTVRRHHRLPRSGRRGAWGVALGDLDGDGRDEIVIADPTQARLTIFRMTAHQ